MPILEKVCIFLYLGHFGSEFQLTPTAAAARRQFFHLARALAHSGQGWNIPFGNPSLRYRYGNVISCCFIIICFFCFRQHFQFAISNQLFKKHVCSGFAQKLVLGVTFIKIHLVEVRDSRTGYFIPARYGLGLWPDGKIVGASPSSASSGKCPNIGKCTLFPTWACQKFPGMLIWQK